MTGANRDEIWHKILSFYSDFAGRPLAVNQEVFASEAATNQRNQAIAMLMYAYGHIKANPLQPDQIEAARDTAASVLLAPSVPPADARRRRRSRTGRDDRKMQAGLILMATLLGWAATRRRWQARRTDL